MNEKKESAEIKDIKKYQPEILYIESEERYVKFFRSPQSVEELKTKIDLYFKFLDNNPTYFPSLGKMYEFLGLNYNLVSRIKTGQTYRVPKGLIDNREEVIEIINLAKERLAADYYDKALNSPNACRNSNLIAIYASQFIKPIVNRLDSGTADNTKIELIVLPTQGTDEIPLVEELKEDVVESQKD